VRRSGRRALLVEIKNEALVKICGSLAIASFYVLNINGENLMKLDRLVGISTERSRIVPPATLMTLVP